MDRLHVYCEGVYVGSLRSIVRNRTSMLRRLIRPSHVEICGITVPVSPQFSPAMKKLLYEGRYETSEVHLVRRFLRASDRVLELGTGLGFIATVCAKIVGAESVATVEANIEMVPYIQQTFRLNDIQPDFICGAVGAASGITELHIHTNFWSSSQYERAGQVRKRAVPRIALGELIRRFRPTVLLIDIEGAELQLTSTDIDQNVSAILIEMHEHIIGERGVESVRKWLLDNRFFAVVDNGDRSTVFLRRIPPDGERHDSGAT